MLSLKYVMLRHRANGGCFPVLGVAPTTHRALADAFPHARPISAGFAEFTLEQVRTYGRSESLGLAPSPDDAAHLTAFARATFKTGPVPF